MIGTQITSFKLDFTSYESALEHLNKTKDGAINVVVHDDGHEYYQWTGMYSHEYKMEILRAYLELGVELPGFNDVGLNSTLGGVFMFVNSRVYTQPIGFSNKNEISSVYYALKKVNSYFSQRRSAHSDCVLCDWRVPTLQELCDLFATGALPVGCYWYSNDIKADLAECQNSYSYCGSYLDFASRRVGHVKYHEAKNSAADMAFCRAEDKGYNVKPILVVVKDQATNAANTESDDDIF